jgi:hypothetical protein
MFLLGFLCGGAMGFLVGVASCVSLLNWSRRGRE